MFSVAILCKIFTYFTNNLETNYWIYFKFIDDIILLNFLLDSSIPMVLSYLATPSDNGKVLPKGVSYYTAAAIYRDENVRLYNNVRLW